nr:hypothetical protein [Anaerolineae bacterium]
LFAMAAGAMALLVAVLLLRLQVQAGVTFWIVLVVLSLGFFGVGFTRGEAGPLVGSLLLDQVLDLVLAGGGLFGAALVFWLTGSRRDAAVQATTPAGPNLGPQPIPPPEE